MLYGWVGPLDRQVRVCCVGCVAGAYLRRVRRPQEQLILPKNAAQVYNAARPPIITIGPNLHHATTGTQMKQGTLNCVPVMEYLTDVSKPFAGAAALTWACVTGPDRLRRGGHLCRGP